MGNRILTWVIEWVEKFSKWVDQNKKMHLKTSIMSSCYQ